MISTLTSLTALINFSNDLGPDKVSLEATRTLAVGKRDRTSSSKRSTPGPIGAKLSVPPHLIQIWIKPYPIIAMVAL